MRETSELSSGPNKLVTGGKSSKSKQKESQLPRNSQLSSTITLSQNPQTPSSILKNLLYLDAISEYQTQLEKETEGGIEVQKLVMSKLNDFFRHDSMKKIEERLAQIKSIERSFLWMEQKLLREIEETSKYLLKTKEYVENPALTRLAHHLETTKKINSQIQTIVEDYHNSKRKFLRATKKKRLKLFPSKKRFTKQKRKVYYRRRLSTDQDSKTDEHEGSQ